MNGNFAQNVLRDVILGLFYGFSVLFFHYLCLNKGVFI